MAAVLDCHFRCLVGASSMSYPSNIAIKNVDVRIKMGVDVRVVNIVKRGPIKYVTVSVGGEHIKLCIDDVLHLDLGVKTS